MLTSDTVMLSVQGHVKKTAHAYSILEERKREREGE